MIGGAAVSAAKVDFAFILIVSMCVVLLGIVTAAMLAFLVRYRRKRHPRPERPNAEGAVYLEITWTVIPAFLVMLMFWIGYTDFEFIRNPPPGAMPVSVLGRQWKWSFTYENGKQSEVLNVPLGRPSLLTLTSADVLHSFYIPAFRIKEDCVPGMKTHLWFNPTREGSFDVFCTEYCGVEHSHMRSSVNILSPARFASWLAQPAEAEAQEKPPGLALMESKGCLGCHTVTGAPLVGPTLKGLMGSSVTVIAGGKEKTVTIDEAYLRKMITDPGEEVVKGFPAIMPKVPLSEAELSAIVNYLKGLK